MLKKLLKAAAAISAAAAAMLIASVTASAVTYTAEKTSDGKTYQLTSINYEYTDDSLTTIKLPTKVDGHTVTKIGRNVLDSMFYWYTDVNKLVIPEGYTEIGEEAFYNCQFKTVELPTTLTAIGKSAFADCYQLETVKLGRNETTIGDEAFYGCSQLKAIDLGPKLTKLGSRAFMDCSSLKSVDLSQTLKTIGSECFKYSGLTTVIIPSSVTGIGSYAFSECSSLTGAYINCRLAIPEGCFCYCTSLKEVILGSAYSIGDRSFDSCYSLEAISIPANIKSIGENALYYPVVTTEKGSAAERYCQRNYLEYKTKTFYNFAKSTFNVKLPDLTYTGKAKTAESISIKYGSRVLKEGTDYKVFYSQNTKVGQSALMIIGMGDYYGTYNHYFSVKPLDLTDYRVKVTIPCASYMYRGRGIKPTVTVKYDGVKIDSSAYSVSFANNTYPGTADITVTGRNGLAAGTYKRHFTVTKLDLASSNVKVTIPCTSYMYRARGIKPTVTVKLGSAVIPAADYTVRITNNTEPGTAYISVTAKGKYVTGSRRRTFQVTKLDVSKCKASIPYASYTYTGSAIKPAVKLKVGSTVIPAEHYTVSYSNNIIPGTANIIVSARGSKATGRLTRTFTVKPGRVKPAKISAKDSRVTLSWKKAAQADGYEIWLADWYQDTSSWKPSVFTPVSLFKTITSASTLSTSFTVNDTNKYYGYGIRAFKTVNGKRVYGDYAYTDHAGSLTAVINGAAKSSKRTAYYEVNTQGSKDIKYTHTMSSKSIAAIEAFAKKNFTADMSDGEKIKKTVDYIRRNFKYNYGFKTYYSKYVGMSYANNALVVHAGQCNEYNGAVCEMLNYLGYDARLIIGYYNRQGNQHYWTEVTLNGKVYVIECGITGYADGSTHVNFPADLTTYYQGTPFVRNSHAA